MKAPSTSKRAQRPEDLLIDLLTVFAHVGRDSVNVSDELFHGAFEQALGVFRASGGRLAQQAKAYRRDVVTHAFSLLDQALMRAERHGLVSFPNPTYSAFSILIPPAEAAERVASWSPSRKRVLRRAAQKFLAFYQEKVAA